MACCEGEEPVHVEDWGIELAVRWPGVGKVCDCILRSTQWFWWGELMTVSDGAGSSGVWISKLRLGGVG